MRTSPRLGPWLGQLALLLQLGMSVLPLVDAALFHTQRRDQVVHIEAAGASCHAGDCVLGQTLQSAGDAFPDAGVPSRLGDVVLVGARPAGHPIVRRAIGIPLGSRAPPIQR